MGRPTRRVLAATSEGEVPAGVAVSPVRSRSALDGRCRSKAESAGSGGQNPRQAASGDTERRCRMGVIAAYCVKCKVYYEYRVEYPHKCWDGRVKP